MKRLISLLAVLVLSAAVIADQPAAPAAASAPANIDVGGMLAKPGAWTVDKIRKDLADQIKPVDYTSHGDKHTANAVPLLAILKASGLVADLKMDPRADPKTKNLPLRLVVVVQGSDGYTTTFSLAELLGDIGAKDAWVCLDIDGNPLSDKQAPAQLIVPGDAKPGRWVRGIAKITVVDPTAAIATSQPTK